MNFLWATIAPAGTILFGAIGEAGRCRSSSSSGGSVIHLRGANKSERFRPYTRLQRRETEITEFFASKKLPMPSFGGSVNHAQQYLWLSQTTENLCSKFQFN